MKDAGMGSAIVEDSRKCCVVLIEHCSLFSKVLLCSANLLTLLFCCCSKLFRVFAAATVPRTFLTRRNRCLQVCATLEVVEIIIPSKLVLVTILSVVLWLFCCSSLL